jgi:hypothetical protein
MSDPTRIELDLPVAIVDKYNALQLPNERNLLSAIGAFFGQGSVLTIHIIVEDSGLRRKLCNFVSHTKYGDSTCESIMDENGNCPRWSEHEKQLVAEVSQ